MDGLHLTADLHGCTADSPLMSDPQALKALCLRCVADVGLRPVGDVFHRFPSPGGVTGVVLLAESHVAIHTWPELRAVTLDVYVCNYDSDNSTKAEAVMATLSEAFGASEVRPQRLRRLGPKKD